MLGLVGLAGRNAHVHLISCGVGACIGMCISHACVRMYMYTYNVMFAYVHMYLVMFVHIQMHMST